MSHLESTLLCELDATFLLAQSHAICGHFVLSYHNMSYKSSGVTVTVLYPLQLKAVFKTERNYLAPRHEQSNGVNLHSVTTQLV